MRDRDDWVAGADWSRCCSLCPPVPNLVVLFAAASTVKSAGLTTRARSICCSRLAAMISLASLKAACVHVLLSTHCANSSGI